MIARRGVTALEATVVVALVLGFVGLAITQQKTLHRTKELALRAQLNNLRASLAFFEARHKRRPRSFEELVRAGMDRVTIGGGQSVAPANSVSAGRPRAPWMRC